MTWARSEKNKNKIKNACLKLDRRCLGRLEHIGGSIPDFWDHCPESNPLSYSMFMNIRCPLGGICNLPFNMTLWHTKCPLFGPLFGTLFGTHHFLRLLVRAPSSPRAMSPNSQRSARGGCSSPPLVPVPLRCFSCVVLLIAGLASNVACWRHATCIHAGEGCCAAARSQACCAQNVARGAHARSVLAAKARCSRWWYHGAVHILGHGPALVLHEYL